MGMYDIIVFKCRGCGKDTNSQTKILGWVKMEVFGVGDKIFEDEFANCILKVKDKCGCGCENAIVIKDKMIIGVENPKYANVVEGLYGSYEWCDELEQIVKEKLKQIENGKGGEKK